MPPSSQSSRESLLNLRNLFLLMICIGGLVLMTFSYETSFVENSVPIQGQFLGIVKKGEADYLRFRYREAGRRTLSVGDALLLPHQFSSFENYHSGQIVPVLKHQEVEEFKLQSFENIYLLTTLELIATSLLLLGVLIRFFYQSD